MPIILHCVSSMLVCGDHNSDECRRHRRLVLGCGPSAVSNERGISVDGCSHELQKPQVKREPTTWKWTAASEVGNLQIDAGEGRPSRRQDRRSLDRRHCVIFTTGPRRHRPRVRMIPQAFHSFCQPFFQRILQGPVPAWRVMKLSQFEPGSNSSSRPQAQQSAMRALSATRSSNTKRASDGDARPDF